MRMLYTFRVASTSTHVTAMFQIVFALDSGDADGAKTFSLWEAYKPAAHLSLRTNQVGSWSPARRLRQPGPWEPFGRRTDLTGLHLTVATVPVSRIISYQTKGAQGTYKRVL